MLDQYGSCAADFQPHVLILQLHPYKYRCALYRPDPHLLWLLYAGSGGGGVVANNGNNVNTNTNTNINNGNINNGNINSNNNNGNIFINTGSCNGPNACSVQRVRH